MGAGDTRIRVVQADYDARRSGPLRDEQTDRAAVAGRVAGGAAEAGIELLGKGVAGGGVRDRQCRGAESVARVNIAETDRRADRVRSGQPIDVAADVDHL